MSSEPMVYRIPDAQRTLGVGRTKLYEMLGSGQLRAKKLGGTTVILAEDVRALVGSLPDASIRVTRKAAA